MADDKKLKRGLSDVSPDYFSLTGAAPLPSNQNVPVMVTSSMLTRKTLDSAGIRCMSILPFRSADQLLRHQSLIIELKKSLGELYFASIGTGVRRTLQNGHSNVRQVALSVEQIQEALHLEPVEKKLQNSAVERSENMTIFIDPVSIFQHEKNLLQILDCIILHVKTDSSESLIEAYQSFRACLEWNPSLRFLLLVDGKSAEKNSELVYEKFTQIASKFMSHEISFMGWIDEGNLRITEDLFLDGLNPVSLWQPSKAVLAKMLRHDLAHHSL